MMSFKHVIGSLLTFTFFVAVQSISHAQERSNQPGLIDPETGRPILELNDDPLNPNFGQLPDDREFNTNARNNRQFCQLLIVNQGTLGASVDSVELSSKVFRGSPAVVQLTATNSSFRLSMDAPLGFSIAPPGGNRDVTMQATFIGTGATNFSENAGLLPIRVKNGSTRLEAHLSAKRVNRTAFPIGNYTAEITLRCE